MQVLTHFPLLKALGWALFDSLWQMAALWLAYSLLEAVFRSAAARIRHRLAFWALGAGTVWAAITFFATLLSPQNVSNPWLLLLSPARTAPGWFWESCRKFMDTALSYGSTIYLLVLSFLVVRYLAHYSQTRKLTRNGLALMPAQFRVFASSTALQLGIRKPVKTWLSSLIDVPVTLGFLKPVILLPVAMLSQLSTQQVEAILIHELGHIRRGDYLVHLLVTIVEALFFFNPFTRLLVRQLKKERENCCDDLVLQFKYDPHAYVSALLSLAALHQPLHRLAVAATGSGDKWLLERARRILSQQKGHRNRPAIRSLLPLLFIALTSAVALYQPLHSVSRSQRPTTALQSARRADVVVTDRKPAQFIVPKVLVSGETTLNFPMHSAAPPVQAPRQRTSRSHRVPVSRAVDLAEASDAATDNNDFFVNTVDKTLDSPDSSPLTLATSTDETVDPEDGSGANIRDFSLNTPMAMASGPSLTIQQGAPVVPNSSFSYHYTIGDSSQSAEQQLYLQLSAQHDVLAAIAQLQQQTAVQLKALSNLQTKATESVRLRNQIREQQQKIQLDYLKKIKNWQQKLEKATHIKVIVYI